MAHFVAAGDVNGDEAVAQVNGGGEPFGNLLTIVNYRESDFDFVMRIIVHGMEGDDRYLGTRRQSGVRPDTDERRLQRRAEGRSRLELSDLRS